mgnify:FL=1
MGLLNDMQAQDQQSRTTETLEQLTSTLPAIEQHLSRLTKATADLTSYVKVMDEVVSGRLERLSSSRQPEQPSTLPLDDETRRRLSEIERTLAAVAEQLSASEAVRLPDGQRVSRSELDAYALTKQTSAKVDQMITSSEALAEAVRKRGNVRINTDRLTERAIKDLDNRLARAVDTRISALEERVADLGAAKHEEVRTALDDASEHLGKVQDRLRRTEERAEALSRSIRWAGIGRICMAAVPFAVVLLVLTMLIQGIASAFGVGPLLGWAWDSFTTATVWWHKALIALAALATTSGLTGLCARAGSRLYHTYRGW